VLAASVLVGLTSLEVARAYRLGLIVLVVMHFFDRAAPPGRSVLRVPVVWVGMMTGVALAALEGASTLVSIKDSSDAVRLDLIASGFSTALFTGGFGRGLGSEQAMIDSGEIPYNFHNIVAQLAAELGLIVAASCLIYLLALVVSWAFVTRSVQAIGPSASLARATLVIALLFYGVTSSSVLQSPTVWAFFALTASLSGVARPGREAARRGTWGSSRGTRPIFGSSGTRVFT
jgi:hypothetical protein